MPRLFVGLDVPASLRQRLHGLAVPHEGVRWVSEHQYHLTLRFIGPVQETQADLIQERLGALQAPSCRLRVRGLGVFPHPSRPRVLWAGVEADERLHVLQEAVEAAMVAAGLPAETRPFHPHITLARLKRPDAAWVRQYLARQGDFDGGAFTAQHVTLYCSTLERQGATYTPICRVPLVR